MQIYNTTAIGTPYYRVRGGVEGEKSEREREGQKKGNRGGEVSVKERGRGRKEYS